MGASGTAGGQPIAINVSGDPTPANNGLFYIYTDHLGSASTIVNGSTGAVKDETRFYPFGEYRDQSSGSSVTDRGFTGHQHNDYIKLVYMNARFYVSGIGRFASADTIVPDPANPQSWNRYSYVHNNPLIYKDPTGHWLESAWDAVSLGLGVVSFTHNVQEGNVGAAVVDGVGIVLDAAALVIPLVPGGASAAIKVYRGVDTAVDVVQAVGHVDEVVDVVKYADEAVELAGSALNGANWKRIGEISDPNVIEQVYKNSCGSACGQMILRQQGADVAQQALIDIAGRPASAQDIARAMNNFDTSGGTWVGAGFADSVDNVYALTNNGSWIANMKVDGSSVQHSIIVEGLNDAGNLMIKDPWAGTSYMMEVNEFMDWWGGFGVYKQP